MSLLPSKQEKTTNQNHNDAYKILNTCYLSGTLLYMYRRHLSQDLGKENMFSHLQMQHREKQRHLADVLQSVVTEAGCKADSKGHSYFMLSGGLMWFCSIHLQFFSWELVHDEKETLKIFLWVRASPPRMVHIQRLARRTADSGWSCFLIG